MKPIVSFSDFEKLDLRIGKITSCEQKEGSEKLFRLKVDFGEEGEKNILSGLVPYYAPEELTGKSFLFILNLEPRKMMGEFSEGMILAADGEKPGLLAPTQNVPAGSALR